MSNRTKKLNLILGLVVGLAALILMSLDAKGTHSFKVDVVGKGKQSIIFIPGLTCPGEVWNETIEQYKNKYTCYVISLPGFAGTPAIETENYLERMRDELILYIKENKLIKPILVGHSLGGFLSLWISATAPDLVGPNFIVDALPFLPAAQNPNATVESSKASAESMYKMMVNSTPEQTKKSQQYFLPSMITAPDKLELISRWGIESHAPTVAKAMYEMNVIDLRDQLFMIKVPVTVLGAWIGYKNFGVTRELSEQMFHAQYIRLKNKQIIMSDTAKHFIMYDDLQWFLTQLNNFLQSTKPQ